MSTPRQKMHHQSTSNQNMAHHPPHWSKALETGYDVIDEHHKEIFHLVSTLDHAISSKDPKKLDELIQFLENYVFEHFDEEETLMKTAQFEGYSEHKEDHDMFKAIVMNLKIAYQQTHSPTHLIFGIRKFIDKLIHHIKTVDIKLSHIDS